MLPYGLAIAVGLSSFILFLTAFLMPKIHRQDDFFWSGLGFFYALVLWFCATQITGAVLLGQLAAVALLVSYSWQVIKLRKAVVNPNPQQTLEGFSVTGFIGGIFNRSPKVKTPKVETVDRVEEEAEDLTPSEEVEEVRDTSETAAETEEEYVVGEVGETATESEPQSQPESELESTIPTSDSEKTDKKPGLFNRLTTFGKQEAKSTSDKTSSEDTPSLTNTKLDELLDDEEEEETKPEAMPEAPVEEVIEEETNWDFLDEEPEITKKEEEPAPESVNESSEEIKEQTTSIEPETSPDPETSPPKEETN